MPAGRRRAYSVRVRILAAILAVTTVGLAAAGGIALLLQRGRVMAAIDDELRQEHAAVRAMVEGADTTAGDPADPAGPEATSTDASAFGTTDELVREAVRVVVPPLGGGTLGIVDGVASYIPGFATSLDLSTPAFLAEVADATADGSTVLATTTVHGREVRYLAVPLAVKDSPSTGVYVSAIDVPARLDDLRSTATAYAWVAAAVLVVVALVAWFVSGRLLHPLRELRRTAARITAGALDERIPVTGNDDLSELTETINAMIARLEEAFVGQRRVLNDVRHELATPITIVRGHLELTDPSDPADVAQTHAVIMDELDRMSGLIAQIAHLADAERRAAHRPRPIDIGHLTRDVFEKVRVIGEHRWRLGDIADAEVAVDPSQLTQAWLQLADNAAKYSPPGTDIEIGSSVTADELRCWVADSGPGIPASARTRIFERFGRAETSRGTAGSGLGLSIVQALVGAHGGRVELDSAQGRGSTFTMVLPRRTEAAPPGADDDERTESGYEQDPDRRG